MEFQKLGDAVYTPKIKGSPLAVKENIEFNYHVRTKAHGKKIDLYLTTKLYDKDMEYICKTSFRIPMEQIENCVKANLVDHMYTLGMKKKNIPKSLLH